MYGTHFYKKYYHAKQHCTNPGSTRYEDWGGRGIQFLWPSFQAFKDDLYESYLEHLSVHGEKDTTIDRIDVNGHYSKENCRWATRKQQARNKRRSRPISHNGETLTPVEWGEKTGVHPQTIISRLNRGWSVEKSLSLEKHNRFGKRLSYTFRGEKKMLRDWAKLFGVNYITLYRRIVIRGMSVEEAFTKPIK